MKRLYEQTYRESIETLYDDFEKLEADRGAGSWNLFNDENGGYGNRDSYRIKVSKISSDTSRSYEYSRQNNKGKSTINKKTNKNFSISASTEEKGELVAVHNLYIDKMMDAFRLGGFPMPSIAVTKAKQRHDKYGPISVVFNKNTIDPKADDRNKVYADAYSPTFPNVKLTASKEIRRQRDEWADKEALSKLQKRYHDIIDIVGYLRYNLLEFRMKLRNGNCSLLTFSHS